MERNAFFRAIANNELSGAYLLHGEEEFVKESALSSIMKMMDPGLKDLNVDIMESAQTTEVIAACETLPFMDERRIVLLRTLPKEDDAARLVSYIGSIPPTALLLFFIRGKVDGRLAFVKAMAKAGRTVEFPMLGELEARRWLQKQAALIDAPITEDTAAFFISVAGIECAALYNELQKAAAYAGAGNEITRNIIAKIVTRDLDYVVFEVLDHFMAGRVMDGMSTLNGLLDNGERALMIAERLREKAKLTIQAYILLSKRVNKDEIAKQLGVSPGYAWRVSDSAKRLSKKDYDGLCRCAQALSDVTTMQLTGRAKAEDALVNALLICADKA